MNPLLDSREEKNSKLEDNLEAFRHYVINKRACIIIIDGGLGVGKTSTAITVARHLQPNFNDEKQVGRGVEQFTDAWNYTENEVKVGRGIKVCVFDEAQEFDRAAHATKRNRALKMFFNTFRDRKTILILCLPHFRRLDASIYDTLSVQMLLHIKDQRKNHVTGSAYGCFEILRMLDFLHRNRNDKHQASFKVYNESITKPNFHFRVMKVEQLDQAAQDRKSDKGKKKLRSESLKTAKES